MNTLRQEEPEAFTEDVEVRVRLLEDELHKGYELSSKLGFVLVQKSFERILRQFYQITSVSSLDLRDIDELEEKKHQAFGLLAEMSEKEASTLNVSSRVMDYPIAANEAMFRNFQDTSFVHAHKNVYQNPANTTIGPFLREDMKEKVVSLLSYRKNSIRKISEACEETQKAVEKIARLKVLPELNADLAIREAANDMFFEQESPEKVQEHKNGIPQHTLPKTKVPLSFFGKIKAGLKKWF